MKQVLGTWEWAPHWGPNSLGAAGERHKCILGQPKVSLKRQAVETQRTGPSRQTRKDIQVGGPAEAKPGKWELIGRRVH